METRARHECEYCLIADEDTYIGCQVDHVINEKHGGVTEAENLALACTFCNRAKGTDIGSRAKNGTFTRLFHPRTDRWSDHFRLDGATIVPPTPIGEVTVTVLQLNLIERVIERQELLRIGRYPLGGP